MINSVCCVRGSMGCLCASERVSRNGLNLHLFSLPSPVVASHVLTAALRIGRIQQRWSATLRHVVVTMFNVCIVANVRCVALLIATADCLSRYVRLLLALQWSVVSYSPFIVAGSCGGIRNAPPC